MGRGHASSWSCMGGLVRQVASKTFHRSTGGIRARDAQSRTWLEPPYLSQSGLEPGSHGMNSSTHWSSNPKS